MPTVNEFGDEAVETPTLNEFGDEAVPTPETPPPAQSAGDRLRGMSPQALSFTDRALRFLRPGIIPPSSLAIGATLKPSDVSKVERAIVTPVQKGIEAGGQVLHEALAPAVSDFLRTSGIDPSSTPENIINLPRFKAASVPPMPGMPPPAVGAGVYNLIADTAESLAQPENLALMFATGGESAVAKASALIFASQQFQQLPAQIQEAITTINNPKSTTEQKIEAVGKPAVSTLLATTMVRSGFHPTPAEKGTSERKVTTPSAVPPVIREPAVGVPKEQAQVGTPLGGREGEEGQAATTAQEADVTSTPAGPEIAKMGPADAGGNDMLGNPLGTQYYASPEDWTEWQKIQADKSAARAAGHPAALAQAFAKNEALKNKYGGSVPLPPKEEPMVTLYHGEGAAEGGGVDTRFFTKDPQRAASYGPNVTSVEVPKSVADAAEAARQKAGKGTAGDVILPDEWVKKAKPMAQPPQAPVFEIPVTEPSPAEVVHADSETAEVGTGGETGAEMNRHGTPSGLPPSVPDNGPTFPAELMEASRQLGTVVRSRVTLPPGVLGMYSRRRSAIGQTDKIEVGDISNQLTVAHEMGHDLDALLWPKTMLEKTQKSLVDRVADAVLDISGKRVTGKELTNELIPVSELMRGPIQGSKGHIAYRKSATELIADYFALYAHDPNRARGLAPMFSAGFEKALADHPDAAGVIHQLHQGDIEPIPGESAVAGPAARPGATPGAVPARVADPATRDLPAAQKGESLVKGLVREFVARVEQARIVADKWRDAVINRDERKDVGAFVEGIGNVEHAGDTIDNVKARMTPEMQRLAKDYRFAIEKQRQEINQYLKDSEEGEYLKWLQDYLPHFYANTGTPAGRSALTRFMKDSPNAKARKLPTVKEAVDLGLIPITQDPAVLYEHHANINWRTATNRKLMQTLKDMTLSTGEPAVVPAKDAPAGWVITNNPLVQKVYARQTPNGVMVWKGGAAIHPDVWRSVRQMLDQPVSSDFAKGFDALNSVTRANAFAFSLFHDVTLRSAALGEQMQWYNPVRGLFRLFERDPKTGEMKVFQSARGAGKEMLQDEDAVADAARHGLKFSWTDSESYQRNARDFLEKAAARWRDVPVVGRTAALARDLQHMRQEGLWKNTHDAFKILAYHDAVSKALDNAPPGTDAARVKEQIASRLNDAFGGQEWQTKFWMSPQMRQNMSRFFLAPDWTFSTLRSIPGASDVASAVRAQASRLGGRGPGPASFEGASGNLGRARFWGGELAALAAATIGAQYAIYHAFGDPNKGDKEWVWENEKGQGRRIDITPLLRQLPTHDKKDPTRYYVNLGKRPEEILGWFTHPEQNIESKMSRPVAEVFRQISGYQGDFKAPWKQEHDTFIESLPERAKSVGKEMVPFVFAGNQFALSAPYRKGMTKFKAQNAYESVYEIAADPGRFPEARAFLRGVPAPDGSLQSMVSQITDAAQRNGVPAEQIRQRALSEVRGHHYDLFFKAFQKDDKPTMEKEADALSRLGATTEQRLRGVERRQALQPR